MQPAVARYEETYATSDESEVSRLVAEAFIEEAILESPYLDGPVIGHEALTQHILATRARLEGTTPRHTSAMDRVGDTLRWTWAFEVDGETVAQGMDVVVLADDERIARLVVFDGEVPAGSD